MNKNLLILSSGVLATVAKDIAEEMNCFDKIDVLDEKYGLPDYDDSYHADSIGNLDKYESLVLDYDFAIAVFSDSNKRVEWTRKLKKARFKIVSIVSPKAALSSSSVIGEGCLIESLVGIGANVSVGECTLIAMGTIVNHSSFVGRGCNLENNCFVNTGAYVEDGKTVKFGNTVESYDEYMEARNHE